VKKLDYNYIFDYLDIAADAFLAFAGFIGFIYIITILLVRIFLIICQWKIFVKANQPGWYSLIPILNIITLMQISKTPIDAKNIICLFIPIASLIIMAIIYTDLAKSFGKDPMFGIGLLFLPMIFFPILAFDSSTYEY
jgi:hypothetical protein